ncbi:MAG: hypothetical protein J5998_06825 [Clostridia bacterium]|nr:hypothetical protein [Clostridia bacterium]
MTEAGVTNIRLYDIDNLVSETEKLKNIAAALESAIEAANEAAEKKSQGTQERAAEGAEERAQAASVKGEYTQKPVEERNFSYDELTKKPDAKVVTVDMSKQYSRRTAEALGKQNARDNADKYDKTGSPMIYVEDLGRHVIVGRQGLRHGERHGSYEQSAIIANVGDILKQSVATLSASVDDSPALKRWTTFSVVDGGNNDYYIVRFQIDHSTWKLEDVNSVHAIWAKKDGTSRLLAGRVATANSRGTSTSSNVSIAQMLDIIKDYFPESLSLDVANHFGYTRQVSDQKVHPDYSLSEPVNTQTDAFKRWFGDSQIVNDDGTQKSNASLVAALLYRPMSADNPSSGAKGTGMPARTAAYCRSWEVGLHEALAPDRRVGRRVRRDGAGRADARNARGAAARTGAAGPLRRLGGRSAVMGVRGLAVRIRIAGRLAERPHRRV